VFLANKATRQHRRIGTLYSLSMVALNGTALGIYELTGGFNLFHATALLSLAMVLVGWTQVLFRRQFRNWLYQHYLYMAWSYVALIAAAINEGFVRLSPLKAFVHQAGNWVIIASQAILIGCAALFINRAKPTMLAKYRHTPAA
jgi:uncharacterized membrane protein